MPELDLHVHQSRRDRHPVIQVDVERDLPDIAMASPDDVYKTTADADHRRYNAVEFPPRIWPSMMAKSGAQHTYSFRDNVELVTLSVVVKNGFVIAVYLEHILVIDTSPFTEGAIEKLRLSIPVSLENVNSKMRNMGSFTLAGIFVRMDKEEQQRRNVQRCLRLLKTHKDANRTRDDELLRAKREENLKKEKRQRSNIQRCLRLLIAQQNILTAQQNVSPAPQNVFTAQQNVSMVQENDDGTPEREICMSLPEYERMEAAEKLRCDAMCADLIS